MNIKPIISSLTAILVIFTSTIPAYAWDPNGDKGNDTGNISGGTFDTSMQGFRVTLLDGATPIYEDGACVDILFSEPPPDDGTNQVYYTNKIGSGTAIRQMEFFIPNNPDLKDMPPPIGWDNGAKKFTANGIAIKDYLMEGKLPDGSIAGGEGGNNPFAPPPPNSGGSNPGSSGLTLEQKKICDSVTGIFKREVSNYMAPFINKMESALRQTKLNEHLILDIGLILTPDDLGDAFTTFLIQATAYLNKNTNATEIMNTTINNALGDYMERLFHTYSGLYNEVMANKQIKIKISGKPRKVSYNTGNEPLQIPKILIPLSIEPLSNDNNIADGTAGNAKMSTLLVACFGEKVLDDIENCENAQMLIEAVVWYRPVTLDGRVAPFWVYGTAANVARHNIEFASVYGNDHGALMQKLTNEALPNSMVVEKNNEILGIKKPDLSNTFIPSQQML